MYIYPGHIVASGAFILEEHRPNDRIVLASTREYYEAGIVGIDEIAFIPVVDGSATLNLYKTGYASVMQHASFPNRTLIENAECGVYGVDC